MHDGVLEGFRLSPQQAHVWRLQQSGNGPSCRTRGVVVIDGPLSPERLDTAWRRMVAGYEILRTGFTRLPGMALPLQVVSETRPHAIRHADLSQCHPNELEGAVEALLAQASRAAPGLDLAPLVGLTLVRLSSQAHLLLVEAPALSLDGPSVRLLARRLGEAYEASSRNGDVSTAPIQYADVAEWSLERLAAAEEDAETGRSYWQKLVEQAFPVRLPWERRRPGARFEPARLDAAFSADLAQRVERAASACGVVAGGFLLTCWQVLLARLTGQIGLVCGALHEGRVHPELHGCLGPLARMLPVRGELGGDRPFTQVMADVHRRHEEADRWHELYALPGEHYFPFCYEYQTRPTWSVGDLTLTVQRSDAQADRYRMKLVCARGNTGLVVELHYDAALLAPDDVRRLAGCFEAVVRHAVEEPETRLGEMNILTPAERKRVLRHARTEALRHADVGPVHRIVEKHATDHPNRMAIRSGAQVLTYGELDERATRLALRLRDSGVGPETVVAICLNRSCWTAVAILAVLKSGGAWLPLDAAHPADRLAFMVRDANAALLITERPLDRELVFQGIPRLLMDDADSLASDGPGRESWPSKPSELAYLIYTSGSTGQPKGVMVSHGSLAGYVQALRARLELTSDDVYLHTATFVFSSSVRQLLAPLTAGAEVVLASSEEIKEPGRLFEIIRRSRVTIIDLVPSYFRACLATLEGMAAQERARLLDNALRLLLTASESLLVAEPQRWGLGLKHGARMVNMFGQTETTGIVATYPIQVTEEEPTAIVPIGRPIPNARLHVLDDRGHLVPMGVVGELYVGGTGLGRGYLRRPGLTAQRFVPDAYSGEAGARLYRTGDLGVMRPNGVIEFVGRVDNQIKVRGFRVEPGEIESMLRQHPDVDSTTVVARNRGPGDVQLTAFVVPSGGRPEPAALQRFAREHLPEYMVPSAFVFIDAMPLTSTGKVNRRDLAQRELSPERPSIARVTPRTRTEETLATIWMEVLGLEDVGTRDDFFELGGNSLLVARVLARIRNSFQTDVPLDALFELSTIAELAGEIDRRKAPAPRAG